ncbi:MAG: hypothetical protein ACJ76Z_05780 [Thermoleophilaceae bacterium]
MRRLSPVLLSLLLLVLGGATAFAASKTSSTGGGKGKSTTTTTTTTTSTTTTSTTPTSTTTTSTTPTSTTTTSTTPTSTTTTSTTPTTTTPTTTTPGPIGSNTYFGFNDNSVGLGQLTPLNSATLASQAGATASRLTFDWRWAEASPGVWDLSRYDNIYSRDLGRGIKPILVLAFAPQWAWADPSYCATVTQGCRYPPGPTHLDAWRDVVTKLVTRYPQMAGLEIWNEPNLAQFWKGGIDPAYYSQLVVEAHNAARAAGSSVPILGGALSGYPGADTATAMNSRNFLKAMYAAGVKGSMDGISLHPYAQDVDLWRVFRVLTDTRDVRDANQDNVPLWVTEIGVTTTGSYLDTFSENDQAVILDKYMHELGSVGDIRALIFHTLVDTSADTSLGESGYGILHFDQTPKPAFCRIAALRATSYVCPTTVAPVVDLPTQQLRWNAQDKVQAAVEAARRWYAAHNTFVGLDPTQLHALDSSLSGTGADAALAPGPTADPSQVGVWVWGATGAENVLLCNTSQADRSYCAETQAGNPWSYGSAVGNVNSAAGATTQGVSTSW